MGELPQDSQGSLTTDETSASPVRLVILLGAAVAFGLSAWLAPDPLHQQVGYGLSGVLLLASLWLWVKVRIAARQAQRRLEDVMVFVEHDAAASFCTDLDGAIILQNKAAAQRFSAQKGDVLSRVLEPLFANPDGVVHRLRTATYQDGAAREDIVTRRGHVRVSVMQLPGGELWRIEDLVDRPARTGDGLSLPMLTASASGTILFMNESLRQALGRRAKRLADLFDDLPLRNGGIHHLRTKEEVLPVRVAVSRPVADRKEIFIFPIEEQVQLDDKKGLNGVLNTLPIALAQIDRNGMVTSLNRAALKLLPKGEEGPVPLASLVEGLGRSVSDWVAEGVLGRGLHKPEVVHVVGAGEKYLQITLGRPVDMEQDGLIAVLNDATELKSIEAQFVQSQKMQAIGQLAGGVAHDFNNLLTAISGHCDLLLLRHDENDPDYGDLNQINQNTKRAAALVGQLLAFSRKQTLKMQNLDLRDTLADLTLLLNRLLGERVRLVVQHDPALIPIRGDRRQLEQVLMNLVVNARDAMPEGGEVRIETICRYLDEGLSRDQVTVPPGQYVVIKVSDEGCGIEPEMMGRIFDPFVSTKRPGEGTGLGLSMAYGIVKQSGGYIFADSEPGKGATFSLYFPSGRAMANHVTPSVTDSEAATSGLSIPSWVQAGYPNDPAQIAASSDKAASMMPEALAEPVPQIAQTHYETVSETVAEPGPRTVAGSEALAHAEGESDIAGQKEAEPLSTVAATTTPNDESEATGTAGQKDVSEGPDVPAPAPPADHNDPERIVANLLARNTPSAASLDEQKAHSFTDVEDPVDELDFVTEGDETTDLRLGGDLAKDTITIATVSGTENAPSDSVDAGAARSTKTANWAAINGVAAAPTARLPDGPCEVPSDAETGIRPQTVLLVEDEAPVRAFASRALRLKGYTVVEAACAEDALETLDDAALEVDLFVTDVMMPGLDGPSWVRQALKRRPGVRTIFVSGYTQNSMTETSAPVPNSYFLPKPFSLADLTRTVQRALQ